MRRGIKVLTIVSILTGFAVLTMGADSSCSSTKTTSTGVSSNATPAGGAATPAAPVVPTRQVTGTAVTLGAGTFTGGKDVAVGLYDVTPAAGESGNFIVQGKQTYNDILGGDFGVPMVRAQIANDSSIEISGLSQVTFTPVTAPFLTTQTTTNLYAGTFKVGEDIAAGRYVATAPAGESGNFMVFGKKTYNEILGGEFGVPNVSVTLSDGDKIEISGLSQVTMTPSG